MAQEVVQKQIAVQQLDVSEWSLPLYAHYSAVGYKTLKMLLDKEKNTAEENVHTIYTADRVETVIGLSKALNFR